MSQPIQSDRIAGFVELIERSDVLDELAQRIIGGETLKEACVAWNAPYQKFAAWLTEEGHTERMDAYKAALKIRADALVADAVKIAATPQAGTITKEGPDGIVTTTEDMLGHRRLMVDTNLKVAARWDRQRFGDSAHLEVTTPQLKANNVTMLEGARRIAFAMARGAILAEQGKRAPRLLEGASSVVPEPTDEREGEI